MRGPRSAAKYLTPKGHAVLAALDKVAAARGVSQAQVALAWMNAKPGMTAPIASATSAAQFADLVAAAGLSLADRACLALAIQQQATAVTANRAWARVRLGCAIELIR